MVIEWTGWDSNPRPPTFPLPKFDHQHARQVFYQTKLPAQQDIAQTMIIKSCTVVHSIIRA